jgi:two-component system NtrC family sensor kinase
MARKAFNLGDKEVLGKKLSDIFKNRDLLMAMHGQALDPQRVELKGEDKHEYRVQVTNILEIGTVATIHDISYLKELDRIKTDFVNTVSHDIRSPLTSILGYVELIQRVGEVNDQQVECINKVQNSVHNITNLITDLLELGKTEGGLYEEFEMVNLSPIIAQSVDGLRPLITEKKQNLSLKLQENLPRVFGNSIQLRQMFDNLIGNAVKYTGVEGKISVNGSEEDKQIILQFTDTGQGIPLNEQSKIFDRFFRASNVSDSVGGTGLGLAITKSIVENHRGRIWVDSAEGRGSVFTVVLPAADK